MMFTATKNNKLQWWTLSYMVFYLVGVVGLILPATFPLFVKLTAFALIFSMVGLFVFHPKERLNRDIPVFLLIFLMGMGVEVIGVNTGAIFGTYQYGDALGLKILNTPLLIGINWLFLTYTSVSISKKITRNSFGQYAIAPTIMLVYDLVLEQLAPHMQMWRFENGVIPIKNYIAWWCIGLVFVAILKGFKMNTKNPMAIVLFGCQLLFFVLLYLYNQLLA